ncbi:rho guanine nucleotide exchange factor 11 isoform X6 [Pelobates cultripes]|uniref:Rho guanine nucleotide exchange factor 11 isoform X6 n=1 Tax=Pelobates cultripes TaxID=61616 RepID=A0AAD1VLI2_PELCU|nr:rho guanine nucleotide exchange factor 11 isoform X6 [Pelobates cultripes]
MPLRRWPSCRPPSSAAAALRDDRIASISIPQAVSICRPRQTGAGRQEAVCWPESQVALRTYLTWSETVGMDVVSQLQPQEILRQEMIHELIVTEESHLRVLRILLFFQNLTYGTLLSSDEVKLVFPNLPQLIAIHNSLLVSLKQVLLSGPTVKEIGGILLSHFDRAADDIVKETVKYCCNQRSALELIKNKKHKNSKLRSLIKHVESEPDCMNLLLEDLLVCEMRHVTKYPLRLENIIKHTEAGSNEIKALRLCLERCRAILKDVNGSIATIEKEQILADIQKNLDTTALKKSKHPTAAEFAHLDLTKKHFIHAGLVTWKRANNKTTELQALLVDDLLVLLRKKKNKMVLKYKEERDPKTKTKNVFSPVIKLNNLLVRTVATDRRAFFVMDTSLQSPQLYEFITTSTSEKNKWIQMIKEATREVMEKPSTETGMKTSEEPVIPPDSCIGTLEETAKEGNGEPSGGAEMKAQVTPSVRRDVSEAREGSIDGPEEEIRKEMDVPTATEEKNNETDRTVPSTSSSEKKKFDLGCTAEHVLDMLCYCIMVCCCLEEPEKKEANGETSV